MSFRLPLVVQACRVVVAGVVIALVMALILATMVLSLVMLTILVIVLSAFGVIARAQDFLSGR